MMNSSSVGKWVAIVGIAISGTWMKIPYTVQLLLMLMGLDVLSGIIAAIGTSSVRSSIMVRGLFKKLAVFPLLALMHIVEAPLHLNFEFEAMAAIGFIAYEAMSIIENCARAGIPIPYVIVKVLAQARPRAATQEEIRREFSNGDQTTTISVSKSSRIVPTPDSSPDMKVDKVVTVVEEKHISPVAEDTK